ncbi:putative MFS transporter [Streptomyces sp. NBRC 110611]|nr:putative MFS transporter [Streptomyces sp. NBRC 110611]
MAHCGLELGRLSDRYGSAVVAQIQIFGRFTDSNARGSHVKIARPILYISRQHQTDSILLPGPTSP